MNASTLKHLGRLLSELAVLLAIYLFGCQLAGGWRGRFLAG